MSYAAAIVNAYPKAAPIANEIVEVARSVGAHPFDLANLIRFESGGTFSPSVRNSVGATGLIQFYPRLTKKTLGISTQELAKLTGPEQMAWVKKYLDIMRGKRLLDTPQKLYMSVFYPAAMSWSLTKRFPANVIAGNPGIETPADYLRFVQKYAKLPPSTSPEAERLAAAAAAAAPAPASPVVMPEMPSFDLSSWLPSMPSFEWPWSSSSSWSNEANRLAYLVKDGKSFREGNIEPGTYTVRVHSGGTWKPLQHQVTVEPGRRYVLRNTGGAWQWMVF